MMIITNSNNSSNYYAFRKTLNLFNISTSKIFAPDLFIWLWSIRKASSYTFCKQTVHQYWDRSTVKGPELWLCIHVWEYCYSDLCANSFVILRQWFGEGAVSVSREITVQLILLMLPKDLILPLEEASSSFIPTQVPVFEDKTKCFKHILQPWCV